MCCYCVLCVAMVVCDGYCCVLLFCVVAIVVCVDVNMFAVGIVFVYDD